MIGRLKRRSEFAGTNKSRRVERYVDEGTRDGRASGHRLSRRVNRAPGRAGRRAGRLGGDGDLEGRSRAWRRGDRRNGRSARADRIAVRYYGAYPEEIEGRIARSVEDADAAEAAWRREQAALG